MGSVDTLEEERVDQGDDVLVASVSSVRRVRLLEELKGNGEG